MAYGFILTSPRSRRFRGLTLALAVFTGAGIGASVGCGSDSASGTANAKLPEGVRSEVIEHEACDESGNKVEMLDANNDGKPDIKKVSKGGREICRITDLNHDGKPDMWEYYDQTGQLRRREADYDDNGIVNSIEHYENGKLVRRELDTTNQGRLDTWDFFDPTTGARTKRERDATGDGKIDQWWTFDGDKVTIAMDRNGDGLPDPDSTITLGSNGQTVTDAGTASAPPPPAAPTATTPPTLSMPSLNNEPAPPTTPPAQDAGVVGKPQRGGAKR
ncbi:MAG: hypothetical protein QOI41_39 [Myxococcales bacterium]|jgi:hypothetical protein|nr:hypothetical protein [Myxococcales bacterium]